LENETTAKPPGSGRVKKWIRRGLLGILALVVLAAIAGASYQALGERADARRFPQQGKSVSLGPAFNNLALSIDCRGQGGPTVVLDSGLGVPAVGWNPVQTEVAKFARVCSYDRAGYGWSGASSAPRTSLEIVKELHALLEAANEKGPYILVGHSFGGYNVRVYNGQYPNDVAGMVLVDASHEDQVARMSAPLQAFMKKTTEDMQRQVKLAPLLIRFGVVRFSQRNQGEAPGVSKEFGQEMLYLQMQPKFIYASTGEMGLFSESAEQVRAAGNLGDKPLVVEKDPFLGGTCLHVGCIPTKVLLHHADVYDHFKNGAELGFEVSGLKINWANILARKDKIVKKHAKGIEFLFKKNKVEWVQGWGRYAGPGRVSVDNNGKKSEIEAANVLLVSGSEARALPGIEPDHKTILTNRSILELPEIPKTLIVVGAGAVGVEFASIYNTFGTQVTILEALPPPISPGFAVFAAPAPFVAAYTS